MFLVPEVLPKIENSPWTKLIYCYTFKSIGFGPYFPNNVKVYLT